MFGTAGSRAGRGKNNNRDTSSFFRTLMGLASASAIRAALGLSTPLSVANGGTNYTGGAWTAYTATITPGAGAITTQASTSTYLQIGKIVFVNVKVLISAIGTASGNMTVSMPVAVGVDTVITGREIGTSGKMVAVTLSGGGTNGGVANFDNSNPTYANGLNLIMSGSYQAL